MNRSLLHAVACRAAIAGLTVLAACENVDLERMIEQPRYTAYEACEVCPNGTIMMLPPVGTVARSARLDTREVLEGRSGDTFVTAIPIALDRSALARGKNRFDIFCAACHGRLGNGVSQVGENMKLRPPANLLARPYADHPPGRVYAAIAEGYGLMRSYAADLSVDERWAVVAYLEALELAQHVALDELPDHVREEANRWLR